MRRRALIKGIKWIRDILIDILIDLVELGINGYAGIMIFSIAAVRICKSDFKTLQ